MLHDPCGRQAGFTIVEALVAAVLTLTIVGAAYRLVHPSQLALQREPEAADMQQRLRVAAGTLFEDVMMAGAGPDWDARAGPLNGFFPPVLPFRQGLRQPDPAGTFRSDPMTVVFVPATNAQTSVSQPLPAQSADVAVNVVAGCPIVASMCGFVPGMNVLVYDDSGAFDEFTVTAVQPPLMHLQHDFMDWARSYAAGSTVVQIVTHTFFLKSDNGTRTYQLMEYDGAGGNDVPVVEHVVGLQFEYYGDPQPPRMTKPLSASRGPWTTYGPKPPPPQTQDSGYPPGENCIFANDGTPAPASRLSPIGDGTTLVKLTAAQLTDGPWCPDEGSPNRYDADLLRIRRIGVTLRVQSAVDALRGPAGLLFAHSGTSRSGNRFLPDREVRFQVAPRNLNLGR